MFTVKKCLTDNHIFLSMIFKALDKNKKCILHINLHIYKNVLPKYHPFSKKVPFSNKFLRYRI